MPWVRPVEDVTFGSIHGEMRYCVVNDRPKTPFLYTRLGYGFNLTEPQITTSGGVNLGIGFGQSSRTRGKDIFSVMAGFIVQNGRYEKQTRISGRPPQSIFYSIMGIEVKVEWRF